MKLVNIELAKKLKSLGFDRVCTNVSIDSEIINTLSGYSESCYYVNSDFKNTDDFTIPDVYQVFDWLLVEKRIFIETIHNPLHGYNWSLSFLDTKEEIYPFKGYIENYPEAIINATNWLIKNNKI